jgi:hypothetical protein
LLAQTYKFSLLISFSFLKNSNLYTKVIELEVVDTPPGIRGDTESGGIKTARNSVDCMEYSKK